MKKRRVFVTLEIETGLPLSDLRARDAWPGHFHIVQVQVNVAKAVPTRAGRRLRKGA